MFKSLIAQFDKIFSWLAWAWQEFWRALNALFTKAWAVGLMLIAAVWKVWDWVNKAVAQVVGIVDQLAFPELTKQQATGPVMSVCEICNTFLPLQELFSFLILYAALYGLVMLYRLIKSWIPGLT